MKQERWEGRRGEIECNPVRCFPWSVLFPSVPPFFAPPCQRNKNIEAENMYLAQADAHGWRLKNNIYFYKDLTTTAIMPEV